MNWDPTKASSLHVPQEMMAAIYQAQNTANSQGQIFLTNSHGGQQMMGGDVPHLVTNHPQSNVLNMSAQQSQPVQQQAPRPTSSGFKKIHESQPVVDGRQTVYAGAAPSAEVVPKFNGDDDNTKIRLIALVKAVNEIWQPGSLTDKAVVEARQHGWEAIARKMNTNVANVKMVWGKLRQDYRCAYKRAMSKFDKCTRQDETFESFMTWKFATPLEFLLPIIHAAHVEAKNPTKTLAKAKPTATLPHRPAVVQAPESWENRADELGASTSDLPRVDDGDVAGGSVSRIRPVVKNGRIMAYHNPMTIAERKALKMHKRNMHFGSYVGTSLSAMSPADQLRARLRIHQVICDMESDEL